MLNFIINMIELSRKRLHGWNYRVVADLEDCIPQQLRGAQGLCDQSRCARVWKITDTACKAATLKTSVARAAALIQIFVFWFLTW